MLFFFSSFMQFQNLPLDIKFTRVVLIFSEFMGNIQLFLVLIFHNFTVFYRRVKKKF